MVSAVYIDPFPPAADLGDDGDMHGDSKANVWRLKRDGVWTFLFDHSALAAEDAKKSPATARNGDKVFFPQRMEEFRGPFKKTKGDSPEPLDTVLYADAARKLLRGA